MYVQGQGRLAPRQRAQRVAEQLVARGARDRGLLADGERVRARPGDGQSQRAQLVEEAAPEAGELPEPPVDMGVETGSQLDHGCVGLRQRVERELVGELRDNVIAGLR